MTALQQLSEIQIAVNHLDDAAKSLETVLKKKPHDAVALNNLAWVYQQKNDPRARAWHARRTCWPRVRRPLTRWDGS